MKKLSLLIASCFMLINGILAQIGPIQTSEDPREMMCISEGVYLYRIKANNSYVMEINSDNDYEDKIVTLHLGKGIDQPINSILNLRKALENKDVTFKVEGYSFKAYDGYAYIENGPGMAYAAGTYSINRWELDQCILALLYKGKRTADNYLIISEVISSNLIVLNLVVPKYDIRCGAGSLYIKSNRRNEPIPSILLNKSEEPLSEEQKEALYTGFKSRSLTRTYSSRGWEFNNSSQFDRFYAGLLLGLSKDEF